ncbi:MAG: hypothetical protein Q8R34_00435 [bacterium]|nr:hypothetical protein [bacterium]
MLRFNLKEKLLDHSDQREPHGLPWILIMLLLVLLSVAVLYFGRSVNYDPATASTGRNGMVRPPRTYSVFYSGGVFSPTNLRIHNGDMVKFQNNSLLAVRIVPDSEKDQQNGVGFSNIGEIPSKNSFSYTFSTSGIFNYHNEKNPNEAGAIIIR